MACDEKIIEGIVHYRDGRSLAFKIYTESNNCSEKFILGCCFDNVRRAMLKEVNR